MLGAFRGIGRRSVKFARPKRARCLQVVCARLGKHVGSQRLGYAFIAQLSAQTQATVATGASMREAFGKAPVRKQPFLLQGIKHARDVFARAVLRQFARKFRAAVLAPGQ